MVKRVGILYHPLLEVARNLAQELSSLIQRHQDTAWLCSSWEEAEARQQMPGTDLVLSLGGDGTVLRAARAVLPWPIPILGVNLGRLGFITEISADQAREKLPDFLAGEGRLEERSVLQTEIMAGGGEEKATVHHAINDMVVGRSNLSRLVHIKATIDGEVLTTYHADGVILATATGSTGYSLSAGGPVLHPLAQEMLLQPIAPHFCMAVALILPPTAVIELELASDHQAMASIDGQVEVSLRQGARVRVRRSPHVVHFLRAQPETFFYRLWGQRLGYHFA